MSHDYHWRYITRVKCCHRWFSGKKLDGTHGIAVADESGKWPDETDDGVLWLDKTAPIVVEDAYYQRDEVADYWVSVKIALLDDAGNRRWLGGTNLGEAKELVRLFGMKLDMGEAI